MEWIGLFSIIVVGVVYCMIRGAREEKKRKAQYRQHLIQDYGKYEVKEYSEEQLKTISRLFEKKLSSSIWMISPGMIWTWILFLH